MSNLSLTTVNFFSGTQIEFESSTKMIDGSFGATNDTGRLYYRGGGQTYLIGENLDKLSIGTSHLLLNTNNVAFGTNCISGSKGWYFSELQNTNESETINQDKVDYYILTISKCQKPVSTDDYCTQEEIEYIISLIADDIAIHGYSLAVINEKTTKDLYRITSATLINEEIYRLKIGIIDVATPNYPTGGLDIHPTEGSSYDIYDNTFLLIAHPNAGIIELGHFALAGLESGYALSRSSTTFGINNISYGQYSFSAGMGNRAGYSSAAFGQYNELDGGSCLSAGTNNKLRGNGGFSQGNNNTITGNMSATIGFGNNASGYSTLALGESNKSKGNDSLVLGYANDSFAHTSLISGDQNIVASGVKFSLVGGSKNNISGEGIIVGGVSNTITKSKTFCTGEWNTIANTCGNALGRHLNVTGYASTAIGDSNTLESHYSLIFGLNNNLRSNDNNHAALFIGGLNNIATNCGPASIVIGEEISVSGVHDSSDIKKNGKQAIFGYRHQVSNGRGNLIAGKDHTINYAQTSLVVGRNHIVAGNQSAYLNDALIAGNNITVDITNGMVSDSLAVGYANTIASSHSAVVGHTSNVSGYCSQAFGQGLKAYGNNQFTCGLYNTESDSAIFIVGSGRSDENRANALEVHKDKIIANAPIQTLKSNVTTIDNIPDGRDLEGIGEVTPNLDLTDFYSDGHYPVVISCVLNLSLNTIDLTSQLNMAIRNDSTNIIHTYLVKNSMGSVDEVPIHINQVSSGKFFISIPTYITNVNNKSATVYLL